MVNRIGLTLAVVFSVALVSRAATQTPTPATPSSTKVCVMAEKTEYDGPGAADAVKLVTALSQQRLRSGLQIRAVALAAQSEREAAAKQRSENCEYTVRLRSNGFQALSNTSYGTAAFGDGSSGAPVGDSAGSERHQGLDTPVLTYQIFKTGVKKAIASGSAIYQRQSNIHGRATLLAVNFDALATQIARKI